LGLGFGVVRWWVVDFFVVCVCALARVWGGWWVVVLVCCFLVVLSALRWGCVMCSGGVGFVGWGVGGVGGIAGVFCVCGVVVVVRCIFWGVGLLCCGIGLGYFSCCLCGCVC